VSRCPRRRLTTHEDHEAHEVHEDCTQRDTAGASPDTAGPSSAGRIVSEAGGAGQVEPAHANSPSARAACVGRFRLSLPRCARLDGSARCARGLRVLGVLRDLPEKRWPVSAWSRENLAKQRRTWKVERRVVLPSAFYGSRPPSTLYRSRRPAGRLRGAASPGGRPCGARAAPRRVPALRRAVENLRVHRVPAPHDS